MKIFQRVPIDRFGLKAEGVIEAKRPSIPDISSESESSVIESHATSEPCDDKLIEFVSLNDSDLKNKEQSLSNSKFSRLTDAE